MLAVFRIDHLDDISRRQQLRRKGFRGELWFVQYRHDLDGHEVVCLFGSERERARWDQPRGLGQSERRFSRGWIEVARGRMRLKEKENG